ncbi:MAG TPA: hypothetical protein VLW85_24505 [Myxococcales bacterium]|nr:hypothetical protein [Myxococcales bacterium]
MTQGLGTRHAPSWRLIQAHFGLGVAGLIAFAAALAVCAPSLQGFFFQPVLLGLVHLCVLGWLMPIAIGALHQLVPVVFQVPVRSERLAWAAFALYVVGAPGLIAGFFTLDTSEPAGLLLPVSATLTALALLLYAANLLATLGGAGFARNGRSPQGGALAKSARRTLTGVHVHAALCWLSIAVMLGALMAWNLRAPFLPLFHVSVLRAHAHAAALGFFGLLIMGVAYRLLEMFLLSYGAPERAGWLGFFAVNAAVLLLGASFFGAGDILLRAGVASAAVGVAAFAVQVRAIFIRRTKRRIDVSWQHTATSIAYFALALAAGGTLALVPVGEPWWDRLHVAYALLAIPGFIGTIVVAQLYKILPFLVWLHRFSQFVGLKKVPAASELLPEAPKRVQYFAMHIGLAALVAGVLADCAPLRTGGAVLFAGSALLFARNLGVIYARQP